VKSALNAAHASKGEIKALKQRHREATMEEVKYFAASLSKME